MTSHFSEVSLTYKSSKPVKDLATVRSPIDAVKILRKIWNEDTIQIREEFVILILNHSKKCLGWSLISIGGPTSTIVDVTSILKILLLGNASSAILCHSHPSGTLKPSLADKNLTKKIKKASNYIGLEIDDHIILTRDGYYSFKDGGHL